jgi:hypothetical protein
MKIRMRQRQSDDRGIDNAGEHFLDEVRRIAMSGTDDTFGEHFFMQCAEASEQFLINKGR